MFLKEFFLAFSFKAPVIEYYCGPQDFFLLPDYFFLSQTVTKQWLIDNNGTRYIPRVVVLVNSSSL